MFAAALTLVIMLPVWAYIPIHVRFSTPIHTDEGVVYQANSAGGCLLFLAFCAFMVVAIYPLFCLLILSANQRAEDFLTLRAIGVNVSPAVPHEFRWYVILSLAAVTLIVRLPEKLNALVYANDAHAGLEVVRLLFVVPIVYFVLPAWTVVLTTYGAVFATLSGLVVSLLTKARPSEKTEEVG